MSVRLCEVYQASDGAVAWAEGLVLIAWRGSPTADQARGIRRAGREIREASDARVATLAFFEGGGFPRFSEEVREEVHALVDETQSFSSGTALVIAQPGFATAVVRTVLAGAMLVARSKEQLAVFATAAPALEWIGGLYDDAAPWTQAELADLVDRFLVTRRGSPWETCREASGLRIALRAHPERRSEPNSGPPGTHSSA